MAWYDRYDVRSIVCAISDLKHTIREEGSKIMAAIDDVNTALKSFSDELVTFLADVASQISGGLTAAEAADVVNQINDKTTQLQANDPANPPSPTP